MSLIAPLFLLGLGLLALPFWLHRLQTDDPVRETFSSTMFLEASQKRVRVRKQLQHLFLMLLRLLFLALLVVAFAQPILRLDNLIGAQTGSRYHLIVVDTTASISAASVFDEIRDQAKGIVNAAGQDEFVQVYQFGPALTALTEAGATKQTSNAAIDNLEVRDVAGEFGDLMTALSRLDWDQPLDYQVHLVSDFQKTSLPDRFADMIPDLPAAAQISFNFYPATSGDSGNWFIDSVQEEEQGLRINVGGRNTSSETLDLTVKVGDEPESAHQLTVTESGRASLFVPNLVYEAGINAVRVEIRNQDALAVDNRFHLVIDRSPPEPVLLLTTNPFAPAANYLSAVMSSVGEGVSDQQTYRVEAVSLSDFDVRTLERYSWVIVDDIGAIDGVFADGLTDYLAAGGALFAATGDQTPGLAVLPVSGHALVSETLSQNNQPQAVSRVDQAHRMLSGLEGWSDIRFSRAVSVELQPEDKVLVSLEDGTPLLIEQQLAQGKSVLFASSLDNQWNNLPVKPLYVSLMAQAANYLSDADRLKTQQYGGDLFSLQELSGGAGQLVDPSGKAVLELGSTRQPGAYTLSQTGFYQIFTLAGESLVGVNTHPDETDLTPLDESDFENWKQALAGDSNSGQQVVSETSIVDDTGSQREFWLWILCGAAVLLLLESLFANWKIPSMPQYGSGAKS